MNKTAVILRTQKISKSFLGVRAVSDLSIEIEAGKITGIIGPNGSGKTTLVNLLSGFLPFDDGAVFVRGERLGKLRPSAVADLGITRTFQNIRLFEQMTVLDNLLVVLTERNLWNAIFERHTKEHLKTARALLRRVGLESKNHALVSTLSYGQRKLLEISRALAMKADIIFFDEPFAGLFPEMRKIVSQIIRELKEAGTAVVLIEHDMGLIRELADRVIVMDAGELLAEGGPDEVLKKEEVMEAYLGT